MFSKLLNIYGRMSVPVGVSISVYRYDLSRIIIKDENVRFAPDIPILKIKSFNFLHYSDYLCSHSVGNKTCSENQISLSNCHGGGDEAFI